MSNKQDFTANSQSCFQFLLVMNEHDMKQLIQTLKKNQHPTVSSNGNPHKNQADYIRLLAENVRKRDGSGQTLLC